MYDRSILKIIFHSVSAVIFDSLPEGKVNLGLGFPNAETFPLENIKLSFKNGTLITLEGDTLNLAMQYGVSAGFVFIFFTFFREFFLSSVIIISPYHQRPLNTPRLYLKYYV